MKEKTIMLYWKKEAGKEVEKLIARRREDISEALRNDDQSFVRARMCYQKKEMNLEKDIEESLEYTSLGRNIACHSESTDLTELWGLMDDGQAIRFINELMESYDKVSIIVGNEEVMYRKI